MRQTTKTALVVAVGAVVLLAAWPLQAQDAGRELELVVENYDYEAVDR